MRDASPLRPFPGRLVGGAVCGGVYGGLRYQSPESGALVGALIASGFYSVERFVLRRNAGGFIPPLPFLAFLALRWVLYVGVILVAISVVNEETGIGLVRISGFDVLFSIVLVVGANLLFSVNDLLGRGVLFAFAAGRYYRPTIEERALLFIDMRASTAIAERLGELRYLDLLNRFVADVSLAVAEAGGDIHKYVGDEVIATWRLAPGVKTMGCVDAVFAARKRIAASRETYEREFNVVPDFRAGLHCGPVAVGELGSFKKEIALIGDTMNTAARILETCRETDNRVLASSDALNRLGPLPVHVGRHHLGSLPVRGKERPLELEALKPHEEF